MTLEQTVAAALTASAEVSALVLDRVCPLKLPQTAQLPAVAYQRIESSPEYTLQGYGSELVKLSLRSFSGNYDEARELAAAVRRVMIDAPFLAIAQKEADTLDEESGAFCIQTEYLIQQTKGHDHG